MSRLLLLIAALLTLPACDSVEPPTEEEEPAAEDGPAVAALRVFSDRATFGSFSRDQQEDPDRFGVGLYGTGDIGAREEAQGLFSTFASGLWLGGIQGGTTRTNAVWYGGNRDGQAGYGNYSNDCGDGPTGLFALDADTTYTDTDPWPRALGAPVGDDGEPRVYGDRMLWGSACTVADASSGKFSAPLDGVRVNTAVFGYNDEPGIRYVRYELTNAGTPISDLRVGYWADVDIASSDAQAFDSTSEFSYIYSLAKGSDGAFRSALVSGFAFLNTPRDVDLYAHRIMRKNQSSAFAGFDETAENPEDLVEALSGLSFAGDPMIDPTTGQETRFAFTGDPFAGTGWVDARREDGSYDGEDTRLLTSLAPFDLGTDESVTFTLVWVTADSSSPGVSKFEIDRLLSDVRASPSRWQL